MEKPNCAYSPDPHQKRLGHVTLPTEVFCKLPPHPQQRNTGRHAIALAGRGVLSQQLDLHDEVAVLASGTDLAALQASFDADPEAFVRQCRKLNGHTRALIWPDVNVAIPAPPTVLVTVYAATSVDAASKLYQAMDNLASAKTTVDTAYSTLLTAGIKPKSEFMKRSSVLAGASLIADHVRETGNVPQRVKVAPLLDEMPLDMQFPALPAMRRIKSAIEALDALNLVPRSPMPLTVPYVAAYLLMLLDQPVQAAKFLQLVRDGLGEQTGGRMDGVYIVGAAKAHFKASKLEGPSKTRAIVATMLNAFNAHLNGVTYEVGSFPTGVAILKTMFKDYRKGIAQVPLDAVLAATAVGKPRARKQP